MKGPELWSDEGYHLNSFVIILLILVISIIVWFAMTSRISSIVGRAVDNLYRLSILAEGEEYDAAQLAIKMMRYQFNRLDEKNISHDQFILIAKKVRPKHKVERVLKFLHSIENVPDLDFMFGKTESIEVSDKKSVELPEILDSEVGLRKLTSEPSNPFKEISSVGTADESKGKDYAILNVGKYLSEMGYQLTAYGISVAILELKSGYSEAETASHIALTTLALDVRKAGNDVIKLFSYLPQAEKLLIILKGYKEQGLMCQKLWKNDSVAIWNVVKIDKQQNEWIEKILKDPIAGKERLAYSTLNHPQASDDII